MVTLNKYKDFIGEKWVDGNWQDDNHPIDDEDVKNIFIDYLDHFNLHGGIEIIKNFTASHLNKYVFHTASVRSRFDDLIPRKHFIVVIKFTVDSSVTFDQYQDIDNRYFIKKYINEASDLILDISERMEDIGYYLRYPDIRIFSNIFGGLARQKEIVFRFTEMDSRGSTQTLDKGYNNERVEFSGYQATMESKISIPSLEDVKNIFTDFLDKHDIHNSLINVSGNLIDVRKDHIKTHRYKSLKDKNKRLDNLKDKIVFSVEFKIQHPDFCKIFNLRLSVDDDGTHTYDNIDYQTLSLHEVGLKLKSDEEFNIACERIQDEGFYFKDIRTYYEFDSMNIFVFFEKVPIIKESKVEIKRPIKIYKRIGSNEEFVEEIIDESEIKSEYSKYTEMSKAIVKDYPEFSINHRGNQFFDIYFKAKNIASRESSIWVGCYDIIMKEFVLFIANNIEDYHRRKTTIERCMEGEEMDEGFERFVWLWMEIKDEII